MATVKRVGTAISLIAAITFVAALLVPQPAESQKGAQSVAIASPLPVPVTAPVALPVNVPLGVRVRADMPLAITTSYPLPVAIGNIASNPLHVRDVDERAKQAFEFGFQGNYTGPAFAVEVARVPSDKRLVIEHLSVRVRPMYADLQTHVVFAALGSEGFFDTFPMSVMGTANFVASVMTKYNAAPNRVVALHIEAHEPSPAIGGTLYIYATGYYVPVQ